MAQNSDLFFDSLIDQHNGYLYISLLASHGVDRSYAYPYIRKRKMKKVARGIYCKCGLSPDMMHIVCSRNSMAIISHLSAAFVHGLISKEPDFVSITVPQGYNAMHLTDDWVRVYQLKKDLTRIGRISVIDPYGNHIRVYDKERTVCDLIREREYRKHRGEDQIGTAIRNYFLSDTGRDMNRLLEYSNLLNIHEKVSSYVSLFL